MNMVADKPVITVPEALEFQKASYGHIVFSREALYRHARAGSLTVVGSKRRFFIVKDSLERLLRGEK